MQSTLRNLARLTALAAALMLLPLTPAAAHEDYPSALYDLTPSFEEGEPPVEGFVLTIGPTESFSDGEAVWFELEIIHNATESFRIQLQADNVPMVEDGGMPTRIRRYLLQEPGRPGLEYVDEETGDALLPRFQFLEHFLPNPGTYEHTVKGWLPTGKFLGHALTLRNVGADHWEPIEAKRLVMNRNLLIGTSRTFKDDGTGRYLDYKREIYPMGEYRFVDWQEPDYRRMIAAGHNYFAFDARHVAWDNFYDEPIFFRMPANAADYPNVFYRSGFMGPTMFIDEPAIRSWGTLADADIEHLEAVAQFMTTYVSTQIEEAMRGTEERLRGQKVPLGDMDLTDHDIPSWDTILETIFYQFDTRVSGLMHEGRYVLDVYNNELIHWFGPDFDLTVDEMLEFQYSIMRGAARSYDKHWGTATYGQMDPNLRIPAAIKAYDMGARYLWFWTSDHDHHVPFQEQLAIADAVMQHQRQNPRPAYDDLRNAADTAIVIPYGYIMHFKSLWGQPEHRNETVNSEGVTYREVIANAAWEGIMALRNGEEVDFVIDMDTFDPAGYERIVYSRTDGTVENGLESPLPGSLELEIERLPVEKPERESEEYAELRIFSPSIDGDLSDWENADWITPERVWWSTGIAKPDERDRDDLSARLAFAVDADTLYIAADIHDDTHTQEQTGFWVWQGDSVQVAFDSLMDGGRVYHDDDVEIGMGLTPEGAKLWRYAGKKEAGLVERAEVVIERTGDGRTVYEVSVPLDELAPLDFRMNPAVGLNFLINDGDGDIRDHFLQWTPGIGEAKTPSAFGTLELKNPAELGGEFPMRAEPIVRRTAAVIGEAWAFEARTASSTEQPATLIATLSNDEGKSVSAEQAGLMNGTERYLLSIPTADMKPGRFDLNLRVQNAEGEAILDRDYLVWLFPPAE